ncbi:MAG: FtsX-like permease family protein, partial [Bacteroidota bacterium]
AIGGSFAPAVYISRDYLAETELLQPGSLVDYDFYLKVDKTIDVDDWRKQHRTQFGNSSMRIETIQSRQNNLKEAFSGLNYFLNLVALVSLLLGCIGVASSVMIYVKSKLSTIAIFRCLGMSGQQSFQIYFFQIVTLGILGVLVGGLLGSAIQYLLPLVLQDFLPYEVDITFSSRALVEGLAIGSVVVTLFALLPLLGIRHISPLRTLRVSDQVSGRWAEPSRIMVVLGILLSLGLFLWRVMDDWIGAIVFVVSMIVAFVLLWIVARVVTWAIRRFYPRSLPYVYRQGLSNLYRPNNQTQTLIISIGLGTAVLTTLFIVQGLLLSNVASMDAGDQPNVILYGIERDQTDGVAELTSQHDLPIIQQVPIVTMALEGWQGRTKKEWLADTTRTAQRWAINREARVSFRDHLEEDETLVRGEWTGEVDPGDSIKISVADTWADAMDIDIGDELVWNVQGARITTYVGSIREIEFRSMRTRFFILFPKGVLEQAPQFQVIVTKSPSTAATASYRSAVVKAFPNVSVVDLGSILSALSDILNKVSYVIQFMAAFCIFTGIIVLISSLLLSKFQRIRESVLLRTVGASSRQILWITTTEYVLLGMLSALTGIVIALIGGYLLAVYQLELDYHIQWIPIVSVFLFVTVVTVLIGLANSRDVINNAPMEVLRKEV